MRIKSFLKKFLVCLLILVLLFNFSGAPHAEAGLLDRLSENDNFADGLLGILMALVNIVIVNIARVILMVLGMIATTFGYVGNDGGYSATPVSGDEISTLGLADIFFNKVLLTDVNIFNISNLGSATQLKDMRTQIALWYYVMRIIAISVLLAILIYVAIRMAIATIATEKARYKKMLVDWSSSIALVFLLHYLIVFILNLNDAAVRILQGVSGDTLATGDDMFSSISDLCFSGNFAVELGAAIVLMMLVTQTLAFLIFYVKRMLTISFLVIISPLITITYSIDRMGDGKAQALNAWFKEFVFSIIIQPFHCIIYLAFTSVAVGILSSKGGGIDALAGAVLAAMCIQFIWNGEKMVKEIFGIKVSESIGNAVASAAIAGTVLNKAKGATSLAAKGAGSTLKLGGKLGGKFGGAINQAAKDIGNTGFGKAIKKIPGVTTAAKKVGEAKDSVKGFVKDKATKIGETKFVQGSKKVITGFKEFGGTKTGEALKRFTKKSTATALGVASGIMTTGVMYGSSADASLITSGIAGYGMGKMAYNSSNQLLNRKVEHFEDRVADNQASLKEITGKEVSATEMGMEADVKDKKGDFKNLKDDRKDTKKELKSKLKAQDPDMTDEEADAKAESALRQMEYGILNGNLDMSAIAKSIGMNPDDLKGTVGDYGSNFVYSRVAEDNKEIDELAGEKGYHDRALAAIDNTGSNVGDESSWFKYTNKEIENASENAANDVFDEHENNDIRAENSSGAMTAKENGKENEYKDFIAALEQLMSMLGKVNTGDQKNTLKSIVNNGLANDAPDTKRDLNLGLQNVELKADNVDSFLEKIPLSKRADALTLPEDENNPIQEKQRNLAIDFVNLTAESSVDTLKDSEVRKVIEYITEVQEHNVYRKLRKTNIINVKENDGTN